MKTLKLKFQLILFACLFLAYSCGNTSTKISAALIEIELDDIPVTDGSSAKSSTKDGELNDFSGTQTINLNDLDGVEKVLKHQSKIESVEVGTASITITTTDEEGTVVKQFVLNAGNVGNFNIDQYNLGDAYTDNTMEEFANRLLMELVFKGNVTFTASGKTDILSGENVKVKITLKDITFLANVMK